ncbi:MAG TPA: aspartyl protease family protein [Anditalea sp.]|nr:aspartyl protease family protein [Anditalea sp.]
MRPYVISLFFIFLIKVSSIYAQIPGFFMEGKANRVEIPFMDYSDIIIIQVSINNSLPINFLLDTGVKANLLFSKTLGDELDLFYTRKLNLMGADGKTILSASISPNNSLNIGPLKGIAQTLLVLDEDFVSLEKVLGIPVHGVIGNEFFKFNPVKIDYDRKIITFYKSTALRRRPLGYKKIKLEMINSKPYIKTIINQSDGSVLNAKLLIDTGANHSLLLNLETSDQIVLPDQVLESDLGTSLGGDLTGVIARVPQMRIGRLRFKKITASFPDETEFSDIILETGRQGTIGSDILSRTKIILDYTREQMYIRRGEKYNAPFEFDMSGITVRMLPSSEKRFYVHHLREGSPADKAGIKLGDEIASVNNIPVEFWELTGITELLRSRDGKRVKLDVIRQKGEVTLFLSKNITLRRQI